MDKEKIQLEFVCKIEIPEEMLTILDFKCPISPDGEWFKHQYRKGIHTCSFHNRRGNFRCKCKDF